MYKGLQGGFDATSTLFPKNSSILLEIKPLFLIDQWAKRLLTEVKSKETPEAAHR